MQVPNDKFIESIFTSIEQKKHILENLDSTDKIVEVELLNTALRKCSESFQKDIEYASYLRSSIDNTDIRSFDKESYMSNNETKKNEVSNSYEAAQKLLVIAAGFASKTKIEKK